MHTRQLFLLVFSFISFIRSFICTSFSQDLSVYDTGLEQTTLCDDAAAVPCLRRRMD